MRQNTLLFSLAILVCGAASQVAQAGTISYNVSVDTSSLAGLGGIFALEFQLNDGSGTGDANNSVTLSHFLFGTGSVIGTPVISGGATGDVSSGVTIQDSSGMTNEFTQGFNPGNLFSFLFRLSAVPEDPVPDQFSFAILHNGSEISTTSPLNAFVVVDIDSSNPSVQTYSSSDPFVTATASATPEPGTFLLLCAGLALPLWKRIRSARA